MANRIHAQCNQRGVVLLEVLIAVLIFGIGIMAVIGLQASVIANVTDSKNRVDASMVAGRLLGSLWANSTGLTAGTSTGSINELPNGTYSQTLTAIADPLGAGTTVGYAANVTVSWQPPNSTVAHTFNAVASIYSK